MTNISDMRKLMETVDAKKQSIDEAGGIIDKGLAKLGGKQAGRRVDFKKEQKHIEDGWKEWQGDRKAADKENFKKNDPESFKEFLVHWNFNNEEIDQIAADPLDIKNSMQKAAKIQFLSKKGVTGDERGGPVKKPSGDDYNAIMTHYLKNLGGDLAILRAEVLRAGKNGTGLDDDAITGWAWLKANGKDETNIKVGKK